MRAWEFINEARGKVYNQRDIDDVKWAYDQGNSFEEISAMTGISYNDVNNILGRHYPERKRRREHLKSALLPSDIEKILDMFAENIPIRKIADDIGIAPSTVKLAIADTFGKDALDAELARRQSVPGLPMKNKVTPEMMEIMRREYAQGKTPAEISELLDRVISHSTVLRYLQKEPDWEDLRAKWEDRHRAVRHEPVATTTVYKSGRGDPTGRQGPGSRQRWGVSWQRTRE